MQKPYKYWHYWPTMSQPVRGQWGYDQWQLPSPCACSIQPDMPHNTWHSRQASVWWLRTLPTPPVCRWLTRKWGRCEGSIYLTKTTWVNRWRLSLKYVKLKSIRGWICELSYHCQWPVMFMSKVKLQFLPLSHLAVDFFSGICTNSCTALICKITKLNHHVSIYERNY